MITDQGHRDSISKNSNNQTSTLELSIVMPCLNESETLAVCIEKAKRSLRENSIDGEIVISDNGSTDGSQELAETLGARVVKVDARGYGRDRIKN